MNKLDLAKRMSDKMGITQKDCLRFLDCFNQIAVEGLQQNNSIKVLGLGRLSLWHQTARPGRNPRTGEDCLIRERMSVKFKASKFLLLALNMDSKQGGEQ